MQILWTLLLAAALGQDKVPDHIGVVNDFVGEIDAGTKARIERSIEDLKQREDVRLVVVTVASLEGKTVEDFAVALFKKWGLGQKGKNNGILFIHAPKERKLRIENGYGVEARLTDAQSKDIINSIIPLMKENKFPAAIEKAVAGINASIKPREVEKQGAIPTPKNTGSDSPGTVGMVMMALLVVAVVAIIFFVWMSSRPTPLPERTPFGGGMMGAVALMGLSAAELDRQRRERAALAAAQPPAEPLMPPTTPPRFIPAIPPLVIPRSAPEPYHRKKTTRRHYSSPSEDSSSRSSSSYGSSDSGSSSSSDSSSSDSFSGGDSGGGGASGDY